MAQTKHRGSCHCGAVAYTVELDTSQPAVICDCSMCGRTGTMLLFTGEHQFTLERGESNLTDYQFGKRSIHHLFCKTCGVKSFARGTGPQGPMVAINVRCLDDVDVFAQPTQQFNGKAR